MSPAKEFFGEQRKNNLLDAYAYRRIIPRMEYKPLNLRLEKELIDKIKIQAIKDGRTVSEIAAELFREYLSKKKQGESGKNK